MNRRFASDVTKKMQPHTEKWLQKWERGFEQKFWNIDEEFGTEGTART
jgi:hypothetical protein